MEHQNITQTPAFFNWVLGENSGLLKIMRITLLNSAKDGRQLPCWVHRREGNSIQDGCLKELRLNEETLLRRAAQIQKQ